MKQLDQERLSKILRKARERKKHTQREMAAQLRIGQNAYSKLESGGNRLTVEQLMMVCRILELDITLLLKEVTINT